MNKWIDPVSTRTLNHDLMECVMSTKISSSSFSIVPIKLEFYGSPHKLMLTELWVSPSTSRSNVTFQPRRFSTYICCDPWYHEMYDGGSNAPLTTHLNMTVLPALTYRSGSPTSSVRGTEKRFAIITCNSESFALVCYVRNKNKIWM